MLDYFVILKDALTAIDETDFVKKPIDAKISLISECFRNILTSEEYEFIANLFNEAHKNPTILKVVDDTPLNVAIQVLEVMKGEIVREDRNAFIEDIIAYFKSDQT